MIGALLERIGFPAIVRPFKYNDLVTGKKITLTTCGRYAVLNVNGREYFFNRDNGKLDGTGYGCRLVC